MDKKGMEWSEIGKWIIILILLVLVIMVIINPVRESLFAQLDKLFNSIG